MIENKDLIEAQTQKEAFLEEQFEVQRWLKAKKKGTKNAYLISIKALIEFTGLSPKFLC